MTRDGVLLSRHENEISGTTDVAAHPEFAARRTVKRVDGAAVEVKIAQRPGGARTAKAAHDDVASTPALSARRQRRAAAVKSVLARDDE